MSLVDARCRVDRSIKQPCGVGLNQPASPTSRKREKSFRAASQTPSRKGCLVNCTQGAFRHQAFFRSPRLLKNSRFRPGLTTCPQSFIMIVKEEPAARRLWYYRRCNPDGVTTSVAQPSIRLEKRSALQLLDDCSVPGGFCVWKNL
jgi:hypothetical protein